VTGLNPILSPSAVSLGNITVGTYSVQRVLFTNTRAVPFVVQRTQLPAGPVTILGVSAGWTIPASTSRAVDVLVLPTRAGVQILQWTLTANDQSTHVTTLTFTGTTPSNWIAPPSLGQWSILRDASLLNNSYGVLRLTTNTAVQLGIGWCPVLVPTARLRIIFSFRINPLPDEWGADGMALLFTDPAYGFTADGLGSGGGLGFVPDDRYPEDSRGIPNTYGLVLNTYFNPEHGDISENDVHVTRVANNGYNYTRIAGEDVTSQLGRLQSGAVFTADISIIAKVLSVRINGKAIPSLQNVALSALPSRVQMGFSGSTGGATSVHDVFNVIITAAAS